MNVAPGGHHSQCWLKLGTFGMYANMLNMEHQGIYIYKMAGWKVTNIDQLMASLVGLYGELPNPFISLMAN